VTSSSLMVRECFVFLELKRRRVEGPPARSQLCVLSTLSSRVTSPVPTSCTVVFNLAGFVDPSNVSVILLHR
jgi:hypothetical protein